MTRYVDVWHVSLLLCDPFESDSSIRSNFAQRSYLGDEGPLLGPEPDDDLPDSSLDDLPNPKRCVPDPLTGFVGRSSGSCPLGSSTPWQCNTPSPAARGVGKTWYRA